MYFIAQSCAIFIANEDFPIPNGVIERFTILPEAGLNSVILSLKGYAYSILGRSEDAVKCYDRVLETSPNDIVAFNNKAWILANVDRNEEALLLVERVLELDPNNAPAWNHKGTDIFFGPEPDTEFFKLKPHKRAWILQALKRFGDYYFWKYNK